MPQHTYTYSCTYVHTYIQYIQYSVVNLTWSWWSPLHNHTCSTHSSAGLVGGRWYVGRTPSLSLRTCRPQSWRGSGGPRSPEIVGEEAAMPSLSTLNIGSIYNDTQTWLLHKCQITEHNTYTIPIHTYVCTEDTLNQQIWIFEYKMLVEVRKGSIWCVYIP